MKKVYISGKISGLERDVYLAHFAKAEELLKAQGYKVVNPTKMPPCRWPWLYKLMDYNLTLLYDIWLMMGCDHIYKIPGWRESPGSNIESCAAYHLNIWPLMRKERDKIDLKLAKAFSEK